MKEGKTLVELAQAVQDIESNKRDFLAGASKLHLQDNGKFVVDEVGELQPTHTALQQVATYAGVPGTYVRTMQERGAGALLAHNVNHWLEQDGSRRMLRTLAGQLKPPNGRPQKVGETQNVLRAFLSDRYRPLDNFDMMQAVVPVAQEKGLVIRSSELTERNLYLKATLPGLSAEVRVGDVVEAGVEVRNSEVGSGSAQVHWFFYRLICLNGMRMPVGMRKYHIGRRNEGDAEIQHLLRDETKMQADAAFWMQFQDVLRGAFDEANFLDQIEKFKAAAEDEMPQGVSVEGVVEVTRKQFGLSEATGGNILENLIRDGDLSRWGLANAITAIANSDVVDYEEATELEGIGGRVIELPKQDWSRITALAA